MTVINFIITCITNLYTTILIYVNELDFVQYYYCYYIYSSNVTLAFTFKLVLCLSFLIFIRGGVPRYRYDFLTKIGWVKFLGYIIAMFLLSLFLCAIS